MFVFLYLFAEFIVVLPEGILTLFELKNFNEIKPVLTPAKAAT